MALSDNLSKLLQSVDDVTFASSPITGIYYLYFHMMDGSSTCIPLEENQVERLATQIAAERQDNEHNPKG